jgi:ribonuclease D
MNIVITNEGLERVVSEIDTHGRFAMDLEFIPERNYRPVLCLVQVATDQTTYIIDPLKVEDLSLLWERVANPNILKVLHAAVQDLDLIFKISQLMPQNIFDTQIAAGFGGFGFPVGYGKLLSQTLGITIAKSESFTDWLERPLSDSQIEYAIEDVCHLLSMADRLIEILKTQGRYNWVLEECKRYSQSDQYVRASKQEFTKVKGANSLNRRGLAVLQALCELREEIAKKVDRPARSVLSDTMLIELSRKPPTTINDIQRMRAIRQDQVRSLGNGIIDCVQTALALPNDLCPTWPSNRSIPKREVLIADTLYAVVKVIAYQADIATELLATRDDVQQFVRLAKDGRLEEGRLDLLRGWRHEMAGKTLIDLISQDNLTLHFNLHSDPPVKIEIGHPGRDKTSGEMHLNAAAKQKFD